MSDTSEPTRQASPPNFSEAKHRGLGSRRIANIKRFALLAGFGVLMALLGAFFFNLLSHPKDNSTTNEVKSVLSGDDFREYSAPDGSFTVQFPGVPIVTEKTSNEDGEHIPLTIYERQLDNGTDTYKIEVYDYKDKNVDLKKVLESKATDRSGNNTQNITQSNSVTTQNGGSINVESHNSVSGNNISEEQHIKLVSHGDKIYVLTVTGADQTKFNQFADSLKFKD